MFAIAITTGALIVILSAMNGLTGAVATIYNAFEPEIRITTLSGKNFSEDPKLLSSVLSTQGVRLVSRSITDKILMKNVDKQTLVTLKGVDENFGKITKIDSSLIEGEYGLSELHNRKIVLGKGIANQLDLNLHVFVNELSLFSPVKGKLNNLLPDDNLNQIYCSPSGIFSLNEELDYQYAFVSLETAQKLFDTPGKISALEIACEKGQSEKVQSLLKEKLGKEFQVKNRYELNDALFRSLETEKLATFIILAFILVIATFNIIGALTMLIIEKRKDIKTLYSMGATMTLIRNIFMREAFLICGIGALLGLGLGLLVCWMQIQFHLVAFGNDFIIPYYPIELRVMDFIWIFSLIMLIGFLAALYPVRVFTKRDLVH
ncbi:MAG: FtsX-like permease family protein [bacterium]|nr:FtsX-like permease family protein [bacterium]